MVRQFLRDSNVAYGRSISGLSEGAMLALHNHSFPGNVRELRNIIEQATLMTDGPNIGLSDLPDYLRGERAAPPMPGSLVGRAAGSLSNASPAGANASGGLQVDAIVGPIEEQVSQWEYKDLKEQVLRRFEDRYLNALLGMTGGNVTKAAELAGVHRVNLHRMIKRRDGGANPEGEA
jgi:DNA-binding NtrC family response regulator